MAFDAHQSAADTTAASTWLERGFLLAILIACAIALAPNNVDPDLWGHVQYAQDALAEGRLHRTATHTFTAVDYPWINHENLAELSTALGYEYLGARGLLVAKCLLGLAIMGLMIRRANRDGVTMPVMCGVLLLVAMNLTSFWPMRPQLFSFTCLVLLVIALDAAFADWQAASRVRWRYLACAPAIMLVWANAHGGYAAGLCILAAYLGLRSLEALWRTGRAAWPIVAGLMAVGLVAAGITLVNPYGIELPLWLFGTLKNPVAEISEWAPPSPTDEFFWPFVLLLAVIVAAWTASQRRRDWTHGIILALCMWQSVLHLRHIAFVALLAGFWIPLHVQSLVARLRRGAPATDNNSPASPLANRLVTAGLCLAFALLGAKLYDRLADFPVERDEYPVDALQYMADHELDGKLVVAFNWAQYALAALPQTQVGFDGRFNTCYPQEVIDMHFDFLLGDVKGHRFRSAKSGPIDGRRVLEFGAPDLVLVDRRFAHSVRIMNEQDEFGLLYQDSLAQLWGRRSRYDDPTSPHYLAESARRISDFEPCGVVTWPALPIRSAGRLVRQPSTPSGDVSRPAREKNPS